MASLTDSASALFVERGCDAITMTGIAVRAGGLSAAAAVETPFDDLEAVSTETPGYGILVARPPAGA